MSARLDQLKRQKQLIEEHLRWLEREIARENGQFADPARGPETTAAIPTPIEEPSGDQTPENIPAAAKSSDEEDADALSEQLISQYAHVSSRREMDPRLGLVLFFGGILGFLALAVFVIYWFGYR